MAKSSIELEVRFSWWLEYLYFPILSHLYRFWIDHVDIDAEPNIKSINRVVKLGTKFYINGKRI